MDVLDLLKKDHRNVKEMVSQAQKGDLSPTEKASLFENIRQEIICHAEAEEAVVYPILIDAQEEDDRELGIEAKEEHQIVTQLLDKIDNLPTVSEEWHALMHLLSEVLNHHIKEEESEVFHSLKKICSKDDRETLGEQVEQKKQLVLRDLEEEEKPYRKLENPQQRPF